jgi:hypothetical protein
MCFSIQYTIMKKLLIVTLILLSIAAFAQKKSIVRDSISMKINEENTIYIKAVFNETDTLILNFDTGTTELILTTDVLKNKVKTPTKLYSNYYNLKIGNTTYRTKVYDAEISGHGTDGRFGWDLFKGKIVELNYDQGLMVIHSTLPKYVERNKKFSKMKIEFFKDIFLIACEIKQNGILNKDLFLFDTGYQRTVMLNSDLLKKGDFPSEKMEILKRIVMHGAQGNEIPVITSNLNAIQIGKYNLKNVPVQVTNANKPFKEKDIHNIGNEVLKRFNTFLDFQNNVVYLKPNHLFNEKYADEKGI